jgi:hypothetical protein
MTFTIHNIDELAQQQYAFVIDIHLHFQLSKCRPSTDTRIVNCRPVNRRQIHELSTVEHARAPKPGADDNGLYHAPEPDIHDTVHRNNV